MACHAAYQEAKAARVSCCYAAVQVSNMGEGNMVRVFARPSVAMVAMDAPGIAGMTLTPRRARQLGTVLLEAADMAERASAPHDDRRHDWVGAGGEAVCRRCDLGSWEPDRPCGSKQPGAVLAGNRGDDDR